MDFRWLPSFRLGAIPEQLELLETSFESRSGSFSTSVPKREFGNQPNDGGMPDQSVAGRLAPNRGVGRESLPIANGVSNRKRSVREHRTDPSRNAGATLPIANGPLIGPFQSQTVALIATLPDGICRQRIADLPPDTPGKALGRSQVRRCPSSIPPPSCCESVKSFSEKTTAGAACNHLRLKVLKKKHSTQM